MLISRADKSILGRWWWSVDRYLLIASIVLLLIGVLMNLAASPGVAARIGADPLFFVRRHLLMVFPALFLLTSVSMLKIEWARWLCWVIFFVGCVFLVLTPLVGTPIKGAQRWITIMGFSLQASEFIKPAFAVAMAWLFAWPAPKVGLNGRWVVATALLAFVVGLLLMQPDFGMAFVIMGIWGVQIFLAGLALKWIFVFVGCFVMTTFSAYWFLPHVASRIDRFLNPEQGDHYQIKHSLDAFASGGWFGQGPGEGVVKRNIPDAHADFIFAVIGEEFGYILCVFILVLYLFIILRTLYHAFKSKSQFISLALAGLAMTFALQTFINVGSSLHLIPTKGMTLPFLSYGGSSLLSMSFAIGVILSLTLTRTDRREA